jgi:hypothetical protein
MRKDRGVLALARIKPETENEVDVPAPLLLKPVINSKTGLVELFDIYIDGKWIGSRRTRSQCVTYISTTKPIIE